MSKKTHSDYCTFSHECKKDHDCFTGNFCDAFELDEKCATQVEKLQRPVTVIDQFKRLVRFDYHG